MPWSGLFFFHVRKPKLREVWDFGHSQEAPSIVSIPLPERRAPEPPTPPLACLSQPHCYSEQAVRAVSPSSSPIHPPSLKLLPFDPLPATPQGDSSRNHSR